ncbi:MAG: adenylate kinase [Clostridia bacterium]|nr:adenylate kinase [Clostridia bacterium]
MKIVLLGPPGSGKSTLAEVLVKKMIIPHISTGDMFRAAIANNTPLGQEAKGYMDRGELVPDEITIGIIKDRIAQPDCREGFLLDGFPRNIKQAESLDVMLADLGGLDAVLKVSVETQKLIDRLSGRRICGKCGATYHLLFNAPKKESVCDLCGGELFQREDDKEEAIKNRLRVYEEQTSPLEDYYEKKGLLRNIYGDLPFNEMLPNLAKALGQNWN